MENLNNQGKKPNQIYSSLLGSFIGWLCLLLFLIIVVLTQGCVTKTHVITEMDGDREIRWYSTKKQ